MTHPVSEFYYPTGQIFWRPVLTLWRVFVTIGELGGVTRHLVNWFVGGFLRRKPASIASVLNPICPVGYTGFTVQVSRSLDFAKQNKSFYDLPAYIGKALTPSVPPVVSTLDLPNYGPINSYVDSAVEGSAQIIEALNLASSWGWTNVFKDSSNIVTASIVDPYFRIDPDTYGMAVPIVDMIAMNSEYVTGSRQYTPKQLTIAIAHEALHHRLYRYAFDLYDHHLLTGMFSIVAATSLYTKSEVFPGPNSWPVDFGQNANVQLLGTATKTIGYQSNLAQFSNPPVSGYYGTHLELISNVFASWGIGGWIEEFCPVINFKGSGYPPYGLYEVTIDLTDPASASAWQIAGKSMLRTADMWLANLGAEWNYVERTGQRPPLYNEFRKYRGIDRAAWLGMFALAIRLGLR